MIAIKTFFFTLLVPISAVVVIPYLLVSSGYELCTWEIGSFRVLGYPLILVGAAFYLECAWGLHLHRWGYFGPL